MTKKELVRRFLAGENGKNHNAETYQRDGLHILKLHNTEIAVYNPVRRTIVLNSGGWNTLTTKSYMNMCLAGKFYNSNLFVIQKAGAWYFTNLGDKPKPFEEVEGQEIALGTTHY